MKTMYWDGEVAAQGPGNLPLVDTDDVVIANDLDSGAYVAPLNGAIDELAFYTYALTATEVAEVAAP